MNLTTIRRYRTKIEQQYQRSSDFALTKEQIREIIAKRAAKEFKEGDIVTLGIGLPTAAANYVSPDKHVIIQSENGILGIGKNQSKENYDPHIINAAAAWWKFKKEPAFSIQQPLLQ